MTSWPSKSTLQRLLDLAGLHYTTSERLGPSWQSMLHNFLSRPLSFLGWTTAMLFWLDFHQTQSNLYKWFRMQRHDWSSTSPKEPMLHLSSSPCTGYRLKLASSLRHWCFDWFSCLNLQRTMSANYINPHCCWKLYTTTCQRVATIASIKNVFQCWKCKSSEIRKGRKCNSSCFSTIKMLSTLKVSMSNARKHLQVCNLDLS